ncbi:MAG: putative rane protein [Bacteroidetes bacterium]|nr:putative rane protein [Bacteroidota bacterium]
MFYLFRKIIKWAIYLLIITMASGTVCYFWIECSTDKKLYNDVNELPECYTGLLLGTSAHLGDGSDNLYFSRRIDAAAKLYETGKIKKIILSGDNRVYDYNEPKDMRKALMLKGVPDSCLVLDYAGLRTFDSMVRCKDIFGQDSVIVISQQFHNARAVFIAEKIGLTAFAFNAKKVTTQKTAKMTFREFFSRIRCVLDLYILNTKPKHLGNKIVI